MMIDEYELFRDKLRQISVQDPDLPLAQLGEDCLNNFNADTQYAVVMASNGSQYGPALLGLYAMIVLMEAA